MSVEEILFAASIAKDIPEIDLHGSDLTAATQQVESWLYFCHQQGMRYGRIIYGGGTGKLQSVVEFYLQGHPLAMGYCSERAGSMLVAIS